MNYGKPDWGAAQMEVEEKFGHFTHFGSQNTHIPNSVSDIDHTIPYTTGSAGVSFDLTVTYPTYKAQQLASQQQQQQQQLDEHIVFTGEVDDVSNTNNSSQPSLVNFGNDQHHTERHKRKCPWTLRCNAHRLLGRVKLRTLFFFAFLVMGVGLWCLGNYQLSLGSVILQTHVDEQPRDLEDSAPTLGNALSDQMEEKVEQTYVRPRKKDSDESKHYDRGKDDKVHGDSATFSDETMMGEQNAKKYDSKVTLKSASDSFLVKKQDENWAQLEIAMFKVVVAHLGFPLNDYLWQLTMNITDLVIDLKISPEIAKDHSKKWKDARFELMPLLNEFVASGLFVDSKIQKKTTFQPCNTMSGLNCNGAARSIDDVNYKQNEQMNMLLKGGIALEVLQLLIKSENLRCCCKSRGGPTQCGSSQSKYYHEDYSPPDNSKEHLFCRIVLSDESNRGQVSHILPEDHLPNDKYDPDDKTFFIQLGVRKDVIVGYNDQTQCSLQFIMEDVTENAN